MGHSFLFLRSNFESIKKLKNWTKNSKFEQFVLTLKRCMHAVCWKKKEKVMFNIIIELTLQALIFSRLQWTYNLFLKCFMESMHRCLQSQYKTDTFFYCLLWVCDLSMHSQWFGWSWEISGDKNLCRSEDQLFIIGKRKQFLKKS